MPGRASAGPAHHRHATGSSQPEPTAPASRPPWLRCLARRGLSPLQVQGRWFTVDAVAQVHARSISQGLCCAEWAGSTLLGRPALQLARWFGSGSIICAYDLRMMMRSCTPTFGRVPPANPNLIMKSCRSTVVRQTLVPSHYAGWPGCGAHSSLLRLRPRRLRRASGAWLQPWPVNSRTN